MRQYLWITRWDEKRKHSAILNQSIGLNFIQKYSTENYGRVLYDLCNGLRMNKGSQTSNYITFIPQNNNEVIKLRLSNHPSTEQEWGEKELTGLPNRRYSIIIFSNTSMPNESKQQIKETQWRSYLSHGIPVYEKCFNCLYLNETLPILLDILKTIYNGDKPEDETISININENQEYKTNKSMKKQVIKLTEQDLHRIIKESVNTIMENEMEEGWFDMAKGLGKFGADKAKQFGQNVMNKAKQFGSEANDYMQKENLKGEINNAIQTIQKLLQNKTIINGYTDRNGQTYKVNVNGLRMGLSSLNKALQMFNQQPQQ